MQIQLLGDTGFKLLCEGFPSLSSVYKMQVLFLWFLLLKAVWWSVGLTIARHVPIGAPSPQVHSRRLWAVDNAQFCVEWKSLGLGPVGSGSILDWLCGLGYVA